MGRPVTEQSRSLIGASAAGDFAARRPRRARAPLRCAVRRRELTVAKDRYSAQHTVGNHGSTMSSAHPCSTLVRLTTANIKTCRPRPFRLGSTPIPADLGRA